ncbi:FKBP-type peptidyl-prolyl cis-trans isomerase [Fulvivirgaceae bacterium PWU5]|uniref:Peptidyl-prolyl cis-trans isomerase n=1 Tax=Dawidia cretensis TaxID=2782350 RepID=A0AAP2GSG4_9BACT|nr:FKBP-type peptidyl-prolyl cis-trans isomerase [Dawidia cretensis]MBT1711224.1 FKBP-type peptidyl-prolyl cis-trans isomerase [Dawidia cretensis]
MELTTELQKISYGLGVLMASSVRSQGADTLDIDAVAAAFRDVFENNDLKISLQDANNTVQAYMQAVADKKHAGAKEEGEKFLADNKLKQGVTTTASGLQYRALKLGNGKTPKATSSVTVHYTGKLINGKVFDSSVQRGQPTSFGVSQVIPGWTEALQLMREGDKWILYIPYNLAYGAGGAGGDIPPFATLIFEVELIHVK